MAGLAASLPIQIGQFNVAHRVPRERTSSWLVVARELIVMFVVVVRLMATVKINKKLGNVEIALVRSDSDDQSPRTNYLMSLARSNSVLFARRTFASMRVYECIIGNHQRDSATDAYYPLCLTRRFRPSGETFAKA